jgi:hypothetical protein
MAAPAIIGKIQAPRARARLEFDHPRRAPRDARKQLSGQRIRGLVEGGRTRRCRAGRDGRQQDESQGEAAGPRVTNRSSSAHESSEFGAAAGSGRHRGRPGRLNARRGSSWGIVSWMPGQ